MFVFSMYMQECRKALKSGRTQRLNMVDLYDKNGISRRIYIIYVGMHSLSGFPGSYTYVYMYSLCMYICKRQLFNLPERVRPAEMVQLLWFLLGQFF